MMTGITNELLYAELLKLEERVKETVRCQQELVSFMREMNRELAEGQAKNEALKKALFGDRLNHQGAALG